MSDPTIAVIGGSGIENYFKEQSLDTKLHACYKSHSVKIDKTFFGKEINFEGRRFIFVNRYTIGLANGKERYKSHEIDYKTMMVGLSQFGIKRIISASKCGSLQEEWTPGAIVMPRDCVDTVHRDTTLDDIGKEVADMTNPFDPQICDAIKQAAEKEKVMLGLDAVYVLAVEGSRLETPSEIGFLRNMLSGRLVVGMVVPTEAQLAKLLNTQYAALSIVTNFAAGMRGEITKPMIEAAFEKSLPRLATLLLRTVINLSGK